LDVGHYTLVEHGSVTFYVDGVSRSLTHEMIRHRHNSYSQLSQRFVLQGQGQSNGRDPFVTPPLFQDSVEAGEILWTAWADAMEHYERLVTLALEKIPGTPGSATPTQRKKEAREAARCVLPNMTPTAIVITGNHSAWRDFLTKRGSLHADAEIRQFALLVFNALRFEEPNIYQDFRVKVDDRNRSYLVRDAQD
jgi:thymidylate synthase (FAD)